MKQILDLVELQRQLDSSEIYEDNDGNKIQTIYLGSILSLTPSGKVYTPWAHSNLEPCKCCKGKETIKNKHGKRKKYEKIKKKDYLKSGTYWDWSEKQRNKINKLRKQQEWWNQEITCPECHGLGSLEARLDQDWWNKLESELETINAWHHESEGNGCDVMISREAKETSEENRSQFK